MDTNRYDIIELYKKLNIYREDLDGDEITKLFIELELRKYLKPNKNICTTDDDYSIYPTESVRVVDFGQEFIDKLSLTNVAHLSSNILKYFTENTPRIDLVNNSNLTYEMKIEIDNHSQIHKSRVITFMDFINKPNLVKMRIKEELDKVELSNPEEFKQIMKGIRELRVNYYVMGRLATTMREEVITAGKNKDFQKEIFDLTYEFFNQEEYKKVVYTLNTEGIYTTDGDIFYTYRWMRDTIGYGIEIINELNKFNKPIREIPIEDRRKAIREHLVDKLGIKEGGVCLYSMGNFFDTTHHIPNKRIVTWKAIKENDVLVCVDEPNGDVREFRTITSDTFLKAWIDKITDDYLILRVSYSSSNKTDTEVLPVKWEMLVPDLLKYGNDNNPLINVLNITTTGRPNINIDNVYNFVDDTMILMTEKNCLSLSRPTVRAVPGSKETGQE